MLLFYWQLIYSMQWFHYPLPAGYILIQGREHLNSKFACEAVLQSVLLSLLDGVNPMVKFHKGQEKSGRSVTGCFSSLVVKSKKKERKNFVRFIISCNM